MKKIISVVAFFLIIAIHLIFLTSILFEKINTTWVVLGVILITAMITYSYYHSSTEQEDHFLIDLQDIFYIAIGGVTTYFLNVDLKLGAVIAAGITGTLAALIPYLKPKSNTFKRIPLTVYCGAFVGMSQPNVASGYSFILFACFLTGILFIGAKNLFNGFGGKLGTLAFGGVAFASLLIYLFL
ncbi:hypothetical protein [Mesonia aestuariivivens]|uniref:Uncharacterized protein n=1 Tax=Mesonia aestuariivivens TaxID=2796128 RepID=A0ABS6VYI6_9FLAO|nr:hypothetical protein [Mesonia aestuariivivens]MBW2960663.1 hypothetical protein [Mesonia aestuariivivens]